MKQAFLKWFLFACAWACALGAMVQRFMWLCAAGGGLLGFITLVVFDTLRGRREDRALRRRFETGESEPTAAGRRPEARLP